MTSLFRERMAEIEALCRRFHVRRLEIFGSAASGQDKAGESDMDFLVEFNPLPPALTRTPTSISSKLSRRFPAGRWTW